MSTQTTSTLSDEYMSNRIGYNQFLHDLADELFPFPSYREGQGEALHEAITELFVNDTDNVILDLPTGIGKSPTNVTIAEVASKLRQYRSRIESHFGVTVPLSKSNSFYTTPQSSLRDQLANDDDLNEHIEMLKARADYTCGASGENCADCPISSDPDQSCISTPGCTYWGAKEDAMQADIAAVTFAMLVIDNEIPSEDPQGRRMSFEDRGLVIVDEAHGLEGQVASLFAGYTVSRYSLPDEVFQDAGSRVSENDERFEDVEKVLEVLARRANKFIEKYESVPAYEARVEKCESFLRKYKYCLDEIAQDRDWVVNVEEFEVKRGRDKGETDRKIQLKPIYVDRFLEQHIWSRGEKRVLSSATIPFRDNIQKWADRIGLPGDTEIISKPSPFPAKHRAIYTGTSVAPLSGETEDNKWNSVVSKMREIYDHHEGEKGVIHTFSYGRTQRVAKQFKDKNVMADQEDLDTGAMIDKWQNSDKDIFVSPAAMEGVDLHGDRARWQILAKAPFRSPGDSRVGFLINEKYQWDWYYEMTSTDIQQAVGRAVRGPEPEESAAFYVIDSKFDDVMSRSGPPEWFGRSVVDDVPRFWDDPAKAPWREVDR